MTRTIVALLISMLGIAPLGAQTQPSRNAADVWRDFATRLPPGAQVTLHLLSGQRFKATLLKAAPDAVEILPRTRVPVPAQRVSYDHIRSIEPDRRGLSTAKAVGIGVGAGVGAFLGMLMLVFASFDDEWRALPT
jgi:hypothetical protein